MHQIKVVCYNYNVTDTNIIYPFCLSSHTYSPIVTQRSFYNKRVPVIFPSYFRMRFDTLRARSQHFSHKIDSITVSVTSTTQMFLTVLPSLTLPLPQHKHSCQDYYQWHYHNTDILASITVSVTATTPTLMSGLLWVSLPQHTHSCQYYCQCHCHNTNVPASITITVTATTQTLLPVLLSVPLMQHKYSCQYYCRCHCNNTMILPVSLSLSQHKYSANITVSVTPTTQWPCQYY